METTKHVIVSAGGRTTSSVPGMIFNENDHEEADTLMIRHAFMANDRNSSISELTIMSPDTGVLFLAIANCESLPQLTTIKMLSGELNIKQIWLALGQDKACALPAFHTFSGADNIGKFCKIGKARWFKLFLNTSSDIISTFQLTLKVDEVSDDVIQSLAQFVCQAYCLKGINIDSIVELRWYLFPSYG